MQNGRIYRGSGSSGNWMLRYWETVLNTDGQTVKRRACVKLTDYSDQYRTESSVRPLAQKYLTPVNIKTSPESVQTVTAFIEYIFLPDQQATLRPATIKVYKDCFRIIKPHLHDITLRDFRTSDAERILKSILAEKMRSHNSVMLLRSFLKAVFKYARRTDRINTDPIKDCVAPKGLPNQPAAFYTVEEINLMIRLLKSSPLDRSHNDHCAVITAALTGLRYSEIRGLKWQDINFDENIINVQQSAWRGFISPCKTISSVAPVPFGPVLKRELIGHRKRNPGSIFVFPSPNGTPSHFGKIKEKLANRGFNWRGWHGFRRGLGTNMDGKATDTTIQHLLRHSDIRTTQGYYKLPVPAKSRQAVVRYERNFKA